MLVLAPWKSVIVRRGLARRSGAGRWTSVAFGLLVLAAVAAGLAHATGALAHLGPVSAMQVHVGAALAALPPAGLARRRPGRGQAPPHRPVPPGPAPGRGGRRRGRPAVAGRRARDPPGRLPGARRRFTGSLPVTGQADSRATPAPGPVDAARIPVTQWLDDRVQVLDPAAWRLRVAAGDTTRDWTYAELEGFGDQVEAVLDCTGGWFAPATWEGVRLDRLLPPGAAGSVVVSSATGYRRRLPLDDAGTLLLATRLAGRPLSAGHGFPARLVAPGRRGFWWVKWVVSVELDPAPWWRQPPFPLT